jgi:hypothetical protein
MTVNEGTLDRTIRVIVGIVLLSLVFIGPKTLWGLIGIAPLLTGAVGHCALYKVLGISTRPMEQKPKPG